MNRKRRFTKKLILAAIVVLAVGGAGFYLGRNDAKNSSENKTGSVGDTVYSNTSDLRKELNVKLAEHVALATEVMRTSYDQHGSSTAAVDELDKNSQELADIIGNFYGQGPKDTFLKQWRDHITFFVNYTISVKNDDKEGKEQALSDLEEYSQQAAEFLAGLNSSLSVDNLKPLFADYRDLMVDSMNDYANEEYPQSLDKESQTYAQAGKLADSIADGLAKQFPEKFSQ